MPLIRPYLLGGGLLARPAVFRSTAAAGVGSYQYWRVFNLENTAQPWEVEEIEMAATVSGADLCTGGTAAAFSGSNPEFAFDNTSNAYVAVAVLSNAAYGEWISYDFGSPVSIGEVRLKASAANPTRMTRAFVVQASSDNSTWISVSMHITNTAWSASEQRAFTVPSTALSTGEIRAWRAYITANNGVGVCSAAEMEVALTGGGADQCTGGVGISSGPLGSGGDPFRAYSLFDDNTGTHFVSNTGGAPWWFGYVFASDTQAVEARIRSRTNQPGEAPKDFVFQKSYDGINWTTTDTPAAQTGWTFGGETRTFTLTP